MVGENSVLFEMLKLDQKMKGISSPRLREKLKYNSFERLKLTQKG